MNVARDKLELREALAAARRDGRTIGLVPTMGALHDGHLALLTAARERCDVVVMSLAGVLSEDNVETADGSSNGCGHPV